MALGTWRRLGGREWRALATRINEGLYRLEDAVIVSERHVTLSDAEDPAEVETVVGFGQYVQRADDPDMYGQSGVYGTAAALEILASSVRRDHWLQPTGTTDGLASRWQRELLGSWLYLQRKLDPGGGVPPAPQRELVLRQTQALRALSSIESTLAWIIVAAQTPQTDDDFAAEELDPSVEFLEEELNPTIIPDDPLEEIESVAPEGLVPIDGDAQPMVEPAAEDYGRAISTLERRRSWPDGGANRRLGRVLLITLLKSRELALGLRVSPKQREDLPVVPGYRFGAASEDLPRIARHWAFHEAAVLVAVIRSAWSGLSKPEWLQQFWLASDSAALYDFTMSALDDPESEDFRVGLFAAWALLHLDQDASGSQGPVILPCLANHHTGPRDYERTTLGVSHPLRLSDAERAALRSRARSAARMARTDGARLTDLLEPYFYRVRRDDEIDYRQEHFVVPTLPIVLSILARLDERRLLDPRVQGLLSRVLEALEHTPIHVVPGQPGSANGMVNMAYLHESLCEVHDACMRIAARPTYWRLLTTLRYPIRLLRQGLTYPGLTLATIGAVVGGLIVWAVTQI